MTKQKNSIVVYNGATAWTESKGYQLGFFEEIVYKGTFKECQQWAENFIEKTPGLMPKSDFIRTPVKV